MTAQDIVRLLDQLFDYDGIVLTRLSLNQTEFLNGHIVFGPFSDAGTGTAAERFDEFERWWRVATPAARTHLHAAILTKLITR